MVQKHSVLKGKGILSRVLTSNFALRTSRLYGSNPRSSWRERAFWIVGEVPHELCLRNKEDSLNNWCLHLNRQNSKGFLSYLVTGDKRRVLYKNDKLRRTVCKKNKTSHRHQEPDEILMSVCWNIWRIIHWELLLVRSGLTLPNSIREIVGN